MIELSRDDPQDRRAPKNSVGMKQKSEYFSFLHMFFYKFENPKKKKLSRVEGD